MNAIESGGSNSGWRIYIVGTGGQGVLTAARLLCDVLVEGGHSVVSGQLHGMAQRGGSVQSSVMIDCGISPVIPRGRAGFVLGLEPVETARALPLMSPHTIVYMNTAPLVPYVVSQRYVLGDRDAEYPDVAGLVECVRAVTPYVHSFDATQIAVEEGSANTVNIVMLGCLLGSGLLPCKADDFWQTVARRGPAKLVQTNAGAFARGVKLGEGFRAAEGAL